MPTSKRFKSRKTRSPGVTWTPGVSLVWCLKPEAPTANALSRAPSASHRAKGSTTQVHIASRRGETAYHWLTIQVLKPGVGCHGELELTSHQTCLSPKKWFSLPRGMPTSRVLYQSGHQETNLFKAFQIISVWGTSKCDSFGFQVEAFFIHMRS